MADGAASNSQQHQAFDFFLSLSEHQRPERVDIKSILVRFIFNFLHERANEPRKRTTDRMYERGDKNQNEIAFVFVRYVRVELFCMYESYLVVSYLLTERKFNTSVSREIRQKTLPLGGALNLHSRDLFRSLRLLLFGCAHKQLSLVRSVSRYSTH